LTMWPRKAIIQRMLGEQADAPLQDHARPEVLDATPRPDRADQVHDPYQPDRMDSRPGGRRSGNQLASDDLLADPREVGNF
jgi:hypothetical protein